MEQQLKILICDDQESDVLMIVRQLEKERINFVYQIVDSESSLEKVIKEKEWNLIICDYNMPGFGGKEALVIIKKWNPDIPFLLISGFVGETEAVEMIRLGATDYLMKNSLSKIAEVVKRALQEAKTKKERAVAIEELKFNEQKYRAVIDNSLAAILIAAPNGKVIESNKAATDMFGYTAEEFKQLGRANLLDTKDPNLQKKVLERDLYGSTIGTFIGIKKSGEKFDCEIASVLFKDINGNTLSSTMISDITERKIFENNLIKSKASLKKAEEIANIGSVEVDVLTENRIWSDGFYKLLGLEPNSMVPSLNYFLALLTEHERVKFLKWYYEMKNSKIDNHTIELEVNIQLNNPRIFYVNAIILRDSSGNATKLIVVVQDITIQKQIQKSLENQNKQLKDIAWTQSHMVRAPLSRLMSIVDVLDRGIVPKPEITKYMGYLQSSAKELDQVIKDITLKTLA